LKLSDISQLFDAYNRTARVFPALIALLPIGWTALAFGFVPPNLGAGVVALLVTGCALYFFASLARSWGKTLETKLRQEWGTWPTTLFLRHRDNRYEKPTKARYHAALAKLTGLTLPTEAEELNDPSGADEIYRSATKQLLELRCGPQYELLHSENASYGFRRNLLGLKRIAISVAVAAAIVSGLGWWVGLQLPQTMPTAFAAYKAAPTLVNLTGLDLVYMGVMATVVRRPFVYQAASEYTDALFRTLDGPAGGEIS
jgi:hypothetical protein